MIHVNVNKENFKFNYLPDYATFLLNNKLTEFVTVGIRFCREVDLPLLKPLAKFSEEELVKLSIESNREILTALAANTIAELIEEKSKKWIANNLIIVDKEEITAEDLTLGFYLRRKIFGFFLDVYTKNVFLQKFIISELDVFTTQEELISLNIYLQMQRKKMDDMNQQIAHRERLLLEAQEISEIGSYLVNFKDSSKSFSTPTYNTILGLDNDVTFEEFFASVHPDDQEKMKSLHEQTSKKGGYFEVTYRYMVKGKEKLIWTKGVSIAEDGNLLLIRGTIRDITAN